MFSSTLSGVSTITMTLLRSSEGSAAEMASVAPCSATWSISEISMVMGYSVALSDHENVLDTQLGAVIERSARAIHITESHALS